MQVVLLVSILVLTFLTSICITTQRLRHIGFRGPVLFILTFNIAICPLPIEFYLNIDQNIFNIVRNLRHYIYLAKKVIQIMKVISISPERRAENID